MNAPALKKNSPPASLNALERRILILLRRAAMPLGAYKIQDTLDVRYPISVYRALAKLTHLGLVQHRPGAFVAQHVRRRSKSLRRTDAARKID